MYFVGGLGLTLAGIFEWVLGKYVLNSKLALHLHAVADLFFSASTFTSVVFITFGGFWISFGYLLQPLQNIATDLGA